MVKALVLGTRDRGFKSSLRYQFVPVAQRIEQKFSKLMAAGSSPAGYSKFPWVRGVHRIGAKLGEHIF